MSRTFEELTSEELDALYQGALFLAGGNTRGAESLLVESVTLAFREHAFEVEIASFERWLETRLVRSFLKHLSDGPGDVSPAVVRRMGLGQASFGNTGSAQLFRAAGAIPAWPRVALWLVLLRRWSYEETAVALGVEKAVLVDLLRYRDVLMKEMIGPTRRGNGARGVGS